ncbi:MMPL family transporter [Oceanispirochaeta sp.]|jgi:predicted RND superfamily exporter protein|uniref:MMPL family transporter n=1 Tax=Oceanispirochaeta sp. TaxID=2035350 RepID=UPI002612F517|nr:MMPL family transporter [Oceanispirochaeta sp.]MDA3956681.1 MMPL family transporter [Oceanispirochaeta sp.]
MISTEQRGQRYVLFLYRFRYPLLVLAAFLGGLAFWTAGSIELKTRIQDMLPEGNPIVASYNEIGDKFTTSSILLTVEQGSREEMAEAADILAGLLKNDPQLSGDLLAVRTRIDQDFLIENGFLLSEQDDIEDYRTLTEDTNLLPFLTALNDSLESSWLDEGGEDVVSPSDEQELLDSFNQLENFTKEFRFWIEGQETEAEAAAERLIDALFVGDAYFFSPDYEMLIIQVSPDFSIDERQRLSRVMTRIREHTASMTAQYPHMIFGASGDIAQEADEETALGADALYPPLAALAVILILFYFSLNSMRSIFFALIALGMGILFDLGLIGATLKELNMITSSFGALLVGLGIDFGIHLITRYDDSLQDGHDPVAAMALTLQQTAAPVAIGGITTAMAFYALCFSKTLGFVQFGFVAGSGIILILLSMFTILPLFLLSFGKKSSQGKTKQKIRAGQGDVLVQRRRPKLEFAFLAAWGRALQGKAGSFALVLALTATLVSAVLLPRLSYDYDMRRIGPQNTPSKATEDRIIDAYQLTPFPSFLAVNDLEEARDLTETIRREKSVSSVSSPTDYLPSTQEQKELLAALGEWHENHTTQEIKQITDKDMNFLMDEVQRLEWNVIEIADITSVNLGENSRIVGKRDAMVHEIMGAESGKPGREVFQNLISTLKRPGASERTEALNTAFADALSQRIDRMTAVQKPLSIADLPDFIKDERISREEESFLITIYPTDILTTEKGMFHFDDKMTRIDPRITGTISLSLALSKEILNETRVAASSVLLVVTILLFITFLSLKKTLLAMANLFLGILWMCGFYTLFGELNLVNILAIPLIIGIGIDYNVHILHGLKHEKSVEAVMASSGKAILLSALTTMIGFGSLALLGTFRGIATLGILLFLGTLTALIASLTLMPVVVTWINKKTTLSGEKS